MQTDAECVGVFNYQAESVVTNGVGCMRCEGETHPCFASIFVDAT